MTEVDLFLRHGQAMIGLFDFLSNPSTTHLLRRRWHFWTSVRTPEWTHPNLDRDVKDLFAVVGGGGGVVGGGVDLLAIGD